MTVDDRAKRAAQMRQTAGILRSRAAEWKGHGQLGLSGRFATEALAFALAAAVLDPSDAVAFDVALAAKNELSGAGKYADAGRAALSALVEAVEASK